MTRSWFLPLLRDDLDARQRRLVAELVVGDDRREGIQLAQGEDGLPGPFEALLRTPRLGVEIARLGGRLQVQGVLPSHVREMIICLVAARLNSAFEWDAHQAAASAAGVTDAQLATLRRGEVPDGLHPADAALLDLAAGLVAGGQAGESTRGLALQLTGEEAVVETATLVGYYELIAHVLVVGGR